MTVITDIVEQLLSDGYWISINCAPADPAKLHEPLSRAYMADAFTPPSGKDGLQSLVATGRGQSLDEAVQNLVTELNENTTLIT